MLSIIDAELLLGNHVYLPISWMQQAIRNKSIGVVRMMFLSVARLKKLLGQIMSKGVLHFSRIES
jgi:hypothetical protein